ncbi:MAG TPA: hypothetical protein VH500_25565 [Nitrososphaeraceae archaeon]|jgi:hypothetical protein
MQKAFVIRVYGLTVPEFDHISREIGIPTLIAFGISAAITIAITVGEV